MTISRVLVVVAATAMSCGGGSGDHAGFSCSSVPSCHTTALAALRACVPVSAMTLGTVNASSGVVMNLTCTAGTTTATFSDFSQSPTGTVPIPANVTIKSSGTTCATLKIGKGTTTDGTTGTTRDFNLSEIDIPMADPVSVDTYADGSITIRCGSGPNAEVSASPGNLDGCPAAVMSHEVIRAADISSMQVNLLDVHSTASTLFACN